MGWSRPKPPEKPKPSQRELDLLMAFARLHSSDDGKLLISVLESVVETDGLQMEQALLAGNDRLAAVISGRRQRTRELIQRLKGAKDDLKEE